MTSNTLKRMMKTSEKLLLKNCEKNWAIFFSLVFPAKSCSRAAVARAGAGAAAGRALLRLHCAMPAGTRPQRLLVEPASPAGPAPASRGSSKIGKILCGKDQLCGKNHCRKSVLITHQPRAAKAAALLFPAFLGYPMISMYVRGRGG